HSKRHHIGQRIVLLPKRGLRIRKARDASIHAVKRHGKKDGNGGDVEAAVHGLDDGIKPGKQVSRRKGIGQQVNAASSMLFFWRQSGTWHRRCALILRLLAMTRAVAQQEPYWLPAPGP